MTKVEKDMAKDAFEKKRKSWTDKLHCLHLKKKVHLDSIRVDNTWVVFIPHYDEWQMWNENAFELVIRFQTLTFSNCMWRRRQIYEVLHTLVLAARYVSSDAMGRSLQLRQTALNTHRGFL